MNSWPSNRESIGSENWFSADINLPSAESLNF
jgi:hypothetical protein